MAPPLPIDQLTDSVLVDLYEGGAIARGQGYAEEDRVILMTSEGSTLKGACRGSGGASYLMRVQWEQERGRVSLTDSCTCPLGGACKHCVAAILTARRAAGAASPPDRPLQLGPDWRRLFADLPVTDADPRAEGLALQFALTLPRSSRWVASAEPRITVRPMRPGRGGKWIKTGASWRDVSSNHTFGLDDADPVHLSVLRALLAGGRSLHYPDEQPISLDRFGPDLWRQLQHAAEVGIEFIGERDQERVALSPIAAQAEVDLTADEWGGLTIAARITHDGAELVLGDGRNGLIGTPPHGLWIDEGTDLRLVGLSVPLHATVSRLVAAGEVTVPANDVDELLDTYEPELSRHATVASSDASVTLTTSSLEYIVLTVERPTLDVAALRWSARYRRGERTVDHPLLGSRGRFRDRRAEADALAGLDLSTRLLPSMLDVDASPQDLTVDGPDAVTLLTDVLPSLADLPMLEVEISGDQPMLREATEDPVIALSVTDGEGGRDGNDWFELDVEVSIEGETVDFVTLFAALNQGAETLILATGTVLRLDRPEFDKLRSLIDEARGLAEPTGTGVARVNRFQTGWWDELVSLGVIAEQSRRWAEGVEHLASLAAPEPIEVPAGLDASLRTYQQEGLDWLAFLHRNRLGGILGDDMGLGKTVQVLALAAHILEDLPDARFLVVAPTSVVENWAREAARFTPDIGVRTVTQTAKKRGTSLTDEIEGASLVITSYALFRIDYDAYAEHDWELLVLDEAQFVKNRTAKTYQCARRLDAVTKLAVTGTPLENSVMDLWSLLSITAPGLYPDPKRFSETYRKPIEKGDSPELLATLRRRIAPFIRRRTKAEVLTDLPPKSEQTVPVEMNTRHARIYATQLQRQRQKVLGLAGDVNKNRFEILKSLTILRQLALDPGLVDEKHDAVGSAKIDRLLDDVTEAVAEGHRVLIFSQFTRFLARVRVRLNEAGIDHAYLDGRTRKRAEVISSFKDGEIPAFVISLKAGGFGLNLTEADYCFVMDPWWNPATETQAVDRTHRIGQVNPVMVYRYVSVGTIEEKVVELKSRKADLFTSVMDAEGALSGALTEADIRGLLDIVD